MPKPGSKQSFSKKVGKELKLKATSEFISFLRSKG